MICGKVGIYMAHETRVNLFHLLEDIRDGYTIPLEEVITTELIANTLDSGASCIGFNTDKDAGWVRVIDNGHGMRRSELKEYHNIAATTKSRGHSIGFAGIGAKLSLLTSQRVFTETKGLRGSRSATEWHLSSPLRAPWKFIPFEGVVKTPKGTAVTIFLKNKFSPLLDPQFIERVIRKHFHAFFHPFLLGGLHRYVYRKAVEFWINGVKLSTFDIPHPDFAKSFQVFLGRKDRRPVGFGYLSRGEVPADDAGNFSGLGISTFGKVIKAGWEWVGILPRSHNTIRGMVEIPGLAEILTTNKADFLTDSASLRKYYRYRKAV